MSHCPRKISIGWFRSVSYLLL